MSDALVKSRIGTPGSFGLVRAPEADKLVQSRYSNPDLRAWEAPNGTLWALPAITRLVRGDSNMVPGQDGRLRLVSRWFYPVGSDNGLGETVTMATRDLWWPSWLLDAKGVAGRDSPDAWLVKSDKPGEALVDAGGKKARKVLQLGEVVTFVWREGDHEGARQREVKHQLVPIPGGVSFEQVPQQGAKP